MPSVSGAQHRLMEAVAHGAKPNKPGLSVKVAKDFVAADKGKKFPVKKAAGGRVSCSTPFPY